MMITAAEVAGKYCRFGQVVLVSADRRPADPRIRITVQ
jgi:hypothetical protein